MVLALVGHVVDVLVGAWTWVGSNSGVFVWRQGEHGVNLWDGLHIFKVFFLMVYLSLLVFFLLLMLYCPGPGVFTAFLLQSLAFMF